MFYTPTHGWDGRIPMYNALRSNIRYQTDALAALESFVLERPPLRASWRTSTQRGSYKILYGGDWGTVEVSVALRTLINRSIFGKY